MYHLRNKLSHSNVVCDKKINACDNCIKVVISSHNYDIAVTLQYSQMESISGIPHNNSVLSDPNLIWMKTMDKRNPALMDMCKSVVDKYINFQYHQSSTETESNQLTK